MPTVRDMTNKVREYIGTPFENNQIVKGAGIDCIGLIVCAASELGINILEPERYNSRADQINYVDTVMSNDPVLACRHRGSYKVNKTIPREGDLILLRQPNFRQSGYMYHHAAYYTDKDTIVHAWNSPAVRKVTETLMIDEWWDNIHSVWFINVLTQD